MQGDAPLRQLVAGGLSLVRRVADLLPSTERIDWTSTRAAAWRRDFGGRFVPLAHLDDIELDDLLGVDRQKEQLERNTAQFVAGHPANNALLWGARGTGKSSLIHALLNRYAGSGLRLVEVDKRALAGISDIATRLRDEPHRFVIVCDDLSFEADDASFKELKSALEGSVFARSENVLIYATSNRRHLIPEYMSDNLEAGHRGGEIHDGEAVEEKISLSDRFGLWLSFYPFRQDEYLDVARHWVARLAERHGVECPWTDEVRQEAFAVGVGAGRAQWPYRAVLCAALGGEDAAWAWRGRVLMRGHPRQVSTSPSPVSIAVPGITRKRHGARRNAANASLSGPSHIGMIAGS